MELLSQLQQVEMLSRTDSWLYLAKFLLLFSFWVLFWFPRSLSQISLGSARFWPSLTRLWLFVTLPGSLLTHLWLILDSFLVHFWLTSGSLVAG